MNKKEELLLRDRFDVSDLISIMEILRAPDGCPWDREQTHASIRKNLIEEAYEVCEGIDREDDAILCEELGDLLLQVVFHAQIAKERGAFSIADVADGICKKLIRRHPHIFAGESASSADEVLDVWDAVKKKEHGGKETAADSMRHVFRGMPALMRAQKVQGKAAKVGFDWDTPEEAAKKLPEELDELFEARRSGDENAVCEEAGDLLFSAVNVVRLCGAESDEALCRTTDKFIRRFAEVEQAVAKEGKRMEDLPLSELDRYWEIAKQKERD